MADIPKYLNAFYPSIYRDSTNTEIQAIIHLQNFMLHWVQQEIESKLQQWTMTKGVNEDYLKQLLQKIRIPFVDRDSILSLANQKKVINQRKLLDVLEQVFQIKKEKVTWNDDVVNKNFVGTINCSGDDEEYEIQKKNLPLLLRYLQLHLMANYKVFINLQFYKLLKDYINPTTSQKYTIQELKLKNIKIGELKRLTE